MAITNMIFITNYFPSMKNPYMYTESTVYVYRMLLNELPKFDTG